MSAFTTPSSTVGRPFNGDVHSRSSNILNFQWQASAEEWKGTASSFDPWQPSSLDPIVKQRPPNSTDYGVPRATFKAKSFSILGKASDINSCASLRGPSAAMLEQERSIRAALCGLPCGSHDGDIIHPNSQGSLVNSNTHNPVGYLSIWAPKQGEGVSARARTPLLSLQELSHLPPKPCDPLPSSADKSQAQEWPALGDTRSTPPSNLPALSSDTSAPPQTSQTGARYSDVANEAHRNDTKSTETIRPGKWGQLSKMPESGKPSILAPKPIREASGSRKSSGASKTSSTLELPSSDRKLSISSATSAGSDKSAKAQRHGQRQVSDSTTLDSSYPPSSSHSPRSPPDAIDAFHLIATGDAGSLSRSKTDHILKSARIHADLNLAYATMLGNHLTLRKMAQERLDRNESCEDLEFLLQSGADQLDSLQANLELVNRIRDAEVQAAFGRLE